ncbi:MAG: hypothetical protein WB239_13490 [Acidimicrobiia bacterium]
MEIEPGQFYLGKLIDQPGSEPSEPLLYESADLVTHGVIVGMTGSGKTGLGIDVLEEALLARVPCLIIDPKGDMGNLKLVFPELAPSDFAPWVDPSEAERQQEPLEQLAADTAQLWRKGLATWDIGTDRMRKLIDDSRVTIYTPGSTTGIPINVLGSLTAPSSSWEEKAEDLRDEIEGFVSSLLVLAGIEADPVSSPPHILLANIVETEWRAGRDLDLARLVGLIQDPPFRKLGVFEVDEFYPPKQRTDLAMKLNALLASPSFAAWLEGEPFDVEKLLMGGEKTSAAIIYLAHLSDSERQFVVTLLLTKLVSWMRRQTGTASLRALVYMDEVFGFAPPVAEPPSKKQILTIAKQARAFGVGMLLSTQNPVDLDYKVMSNSGTWMVGRLQTENDKKRILEGLADAGGFTDTGALDKLISNLDKRQFVMRRAGSIEPQVFSTRWAMSYLAGPLDREDIKTLTPSSDTPRTKPTTDAAATPPPDADSAAVAETKVTPPPEVADRVPVSTLDPAAAWAGDVGAVPDGKMFRAIAAATVALVYDDRNAGVQHEETFEAVIDPLREEVDDTNLHQVDHDQRDFRQGPPGRAVFTTSGVPIGNGNFWRSLSARLLDHLVLNRKVTVFRNEALSLYSRVGETRADFEQRCAGAAQDEADRAVAGLRDRYDDRIDRVKAQISRSDRRVAELSADASARQQQEVLSGAGDLLGALLGGRSGSGALRRASSRRSQTRRTEANLHTAESRLDEEQQKLGDLEDELESEITAIVDEWHAKADEIAPVEIPLERSDVRVTELRLVWVPVDGPS